MKEKRLTQKEFKLPNAPTFGSRKSTMAKAASDGIAPRIRPTQEEFESYQRYFPKKDNSYLCAYCGKKYDYFEHLRPLVIGGKPTGYGSDIYNLVPSCRICNERKANKYWADWMQEPIMIQEPGCEKRCEILKNFAEWGKNKVTHIDYESILNKIDPIIWANYINKITELETMLTSLHQIQLEIKEIIYKKKQINKLL